jgi:hypothetical protein
MQHGQGHAALAGACSMDLDMQPKHGHGYGQDMDITIKVLDQHGQLRTLCFKGFAEELAEVSEN